LRPRSQRASTLARARQTLDAVEFRVMPAEAFYSGGVISGSGVVIDDDGLTMDYAHGKYTKTTCSYSFQARSFKISLTQSGDFTGKPPRVLVKLSFPQLPPLKVSSFSQGLSSSPGVEYDHEIMGSVITLPDVDLSTSSSLMLTIDESYSASVLAGFVGALGHVRRARYIKDALDKANINYGWGRANITSYVLAATHMSPSFAAELPQLWRGAVAQGEALLTDDKTLQKDPRRAKFVADMLLLAQEPAAYII